MEITEDRVRSWSRLSCIVCTVVSGVFCLQMFQGIFNFEQMFKEMELGSLPLVTRIMFMAHAEIILLVLMIAGVLKEITIKDPFKTLNLNIMQMAVVVVMKELYWYAMIHPLITIMDKIGR